MRRTPNPAHVPVKARVPVALAGPDDAADLLHFLHTVFPEVCAGEAEESALAAMVESVVSRRGGLALVVRGPTGIEASFALRFERPWWRSTYHLAGAWNVVAPEYRHLGHAISLLTAARRIVDGIGCPLWFAEFDSSPDTPKLRLCRRHYPCGGVIFHYVPVRKEERAA